MKNLQTVKNKTSFTLNGGNVTGPSKSLSTKIFFNLFFIISFILPLTMSCKENRYDSENTPKSEYNSVTEDDSTTKYKIAGSANKIQGGARASREKIIEYLEKLYLIDDPMNYKVELTNEDLYIDGRKQPDKIHLHIMKNFVENPDGRLEVTYTVSTD